MIVIMFLSCDNTKCKPLHMPNMSRLEIGGFLSICSTLDLFKKRRMQLVKKHRPISLPPTDDIRLQRLIYKERYS